MRSARKQDLSLNANVPGRIIRADRGRPRRGRGHGVSQQWCVGGNGRTGSAVARGRAQSWVPQLGRQRGGEGGSLQSAAH